MILPFLVNLFTQQDQPTDPSPSPETPPVTDGAPIATPPPEPPPATEKVAELTTQVVDQIEKTLIHTPMIGWFILFGGILAGLVIGRIGQMTIRKIGERMRSKGWVARGSLFIYAAGPINLAIFSGLLGLGFTGVSMEAPLQNFITRAIGLLYIVALCWFLYNLVDIVEIGIRRITTDNTIIQLIRKALRIFLLIIFGLFVAENFFNANISAWLAGLGLAGLAVSLAAQGPIKNIFGSVTVVLDRPFGLGDRIQYGDKTGVVEVMGFRSTKLRTAEGHLVTIPNSKLIEDVVENITSRPYIRRLTSITITYDTSPAKVEQAVQIIRDLLAEPFMRSTFDMTNFPPRVHFNNFNSDSLNIQVVYWYQLNIGAVAGTPEFRDWWTYHEQLQQFNMRLLRAYNEAGIDFAFPTQTIHLAGDAKRELAIRMHNGDPFSSTGNMN